MASERSKHNTPALQSVRRFVLEARVGRPGSTAKQAVVRYMAALPLHFFATPAAPLTPFSFQVPCCSSDVSGWHEWYM